MGEQRKRYNEKFKREAVKYIQQQTKTVVEIGEELGVSPGVLHSWLAKYREFGNEPVNHAEKVRELEQRLAEQEKELRAREQRIADVEEELAIVKKAVHIFSKPKN
ncbi:transposase [Paenibacillus sp. HW567]|uniref:transposase n=1 Tax=Paenibacillus sp. HW567 TaxID=1034769 RepID=UPI00036B526D|nr:transposase [Paenibacillus sp. HW567]